MINLPKQAQEIIDVLERNGFEAYAVGGCVRDSLLGQDPHDWDICTSAKPEETLACFKGYHIVETGIKHGTVTIIFDHEPYEVTTFRMDGEYIDNRHPKEVLFVRELIGDLSRRDFTINSMAYNMNSGIVDYFNGEEDLRCKKIRCVGNADDRFCEDSLRIMRALRFAAVLGFTIEEGTCLGIHKNKELLKNISAERIQCEFSKLICGKKAEFILREFQDVLCVFIPEIRSMIGFHQNNPHHYLDVWEHTVKTVSQAPEDLTVRLTMLFHDMGKPHCYTQSEDGVGHFYGHPKLSAAMAEEILRRLRFNNDIIFAVKELVTYHDVVMIPNNKHIRRWLNKIGEDGLIPLIEVKRADAMGQSIEYREERLNQLRQAEDCIKVIKEEGQCFRIKDLKVDGHDLINAGLAEGRQIGKILESLMDKVIEDEVKNSKEELLEIVRKGFIKE